MKYIKTFENLSEELKEGDIVLVELEKDNYQKIHNPVMKILQIWGPNMFELCDINDLEETNTILISRDEIIRKLEDFEIDALKYNI